ncbi:DUF1275 family protein [Pseudarthrobacter sp. So.54]
MKPKFSGGTARLHLVLMLMLTFSTGVVDAVGYLGLDRVFTGNMTGNVVLLGMAVVGGTGLPVLRPKPWHWPSSCWAPPWRDGCCGARVRAGHTGLPRTSSRWPWASGP